MQMTAVPSVAFPIPAWHRGHLHEVWSCIYYRLSSPRSSSHFSKEVGSLDSKGRFLLLMKRSKRVIRCHDDLQARYQVRECLAGYRQHHFARGQSNIGTRPHTAKAERCFASL